MRNLRDSRLARLARNLDEIPVKDQQRIQRAQETESLRRKGAMELYTLCREFVDGLNSLVAQVRIEFSPAHYEAADLHNPAHNLLQINTSGRVVQFSFGAHDELASTEHFRTPYILEGVIRCTTQELLHRQDIHEALLFYCLEKTGANWVVYDATRHPASRFAQD